MPLQVADPPDGCAVLKDPQVEENWIALIIRSQKEHSSCSFDTKVRPMGAFTQMAKVAHVLPAPHLHHSPEACDLFSGIFKGSYFAVGIQCTAQ